MCERLNLVQPGFDAHMKGVEGSLQQKSRDINLLKTRVMLNSFLMFGADRW